MISRIYKAALTCPYFILMILGGVSVAALAAAYIGQYGFDLYPCYLCLWQRIPYMIVIMLAIFGMIATKAMDARYGALNILFAAVAFFVNSAIAFYHVGVEEQWWASTACSMPDFSGLSAAELAQAIRETPVVRCDEVQWRLFGISMAGYNVMLCFVLGIYASIAGVKVMKAYQLR
jgi:disulfide bond formation protein DsbB